MDFGIRLPRTRRQHDAIWVIVDRVMKFAHFLPVSNDDPLDKLAQLYVEEIIRLHGVCFVLIRVPNSIPKRRNYGCLAL